MAESATPPPSLRERLLEPGIISFTAGATYGFTAVLVGQPFDTVKTRMQARPELASSSALQVGRQLLQSEGLRGLYRGGTPLFVGGALFRSAQFGFYENTLSALKESSAPEYMIGGVLDWRVVAAGFAGGIGRGLVEGPFEYVKVRRQVHADWKFSEVYPSARKVSHSDNYIFLQKDTQGKLMRKIQILPDN